MDEATHRRWDITLRILTVLGAITIFLHGINRYIDEQHANMQIRIESEERARERAFNIAMFQRDLDTYAKIAEVASRVAVSSVSDFESAATEYERLYWGNITARGDTTVVQAMDNLRSSIRNVRRGLVVAGDTDLHDQLKRRAHQLSVALRQAIYQRSNKLKLVLDK